MATSNPSELISQVPFVPTLVQNLPWPLPSTKLRACFFKEGKFPRCASSPFGKGRFRGIFNPVQHDFDGTLVYTRLTLAKKIWYAVS